MHQVNLVTCHVVVRSYHIRPFSQWRESAGLVQAGQNDPQSTVPGQKNQAFAMAAMTP